MLSFDVLVGSKMMKHSEIMSRWECHLDPHMVSRQRCRGEAAKRPQSRAQAFLFISLFRSPRTPTGQRGKARKMLAVLLVC